MKKLIQDNAGYIARVIRWRDSGVVNICDQELIGKIIECGNTVIQISPEYFGGQVVDVKEALKLIESSSIVNLVGNRIVSKTIKANLASKVAVKKIGSTSFLMIFKF